MHQLPVVKCGQGPYRRSFACLRLCRWSLIDIIDRINRGSLINENYIYTLLDRSRQAAAEVYDCLSCWTIMNDMKGELAV